MCSSRPGDEKEMEGSEYAFQQLLTVSAAVRWMHASVAGRIGGCPGRVLIGLEMRRRWNDACMKCTHVVAPTSLCQNMLVWNERACS